LFTITPVPIRLRLALLCTALVLAVLGIGGVLFTNVLRGDLLRELDDELRARAGRTVAALRAGAPTQSQATQVVGPLHLVAKISDPDGHIVAASAPALVATLFTPAQLRSAAASGSPVDRMLTARPQGGTSPVRLRLLVAPDPATAGGFVVVGATLDPVDDALDHVRGELLIAAALAAPLSALGAWALAGAALRPVERLRRDVARISERDTTSRVGTPRTRDELEALATTMNALLERLQSALARERRLIADAAHELRSPLTILRTELELAGRRGRTREELVEAVGSAAQETDRLVRLAEDLLFLSRTDEGTPVLRLEPARVLEVLDDAVAGQATHARSAGVELRISAPEELVAVLDEARIRQAVTNLLDNALRMAPAGGAVGVDAQVEDGMAVISVSDSGPGFPPGFIDHAFERFRRADEARHRDGGGTGLGLAIVDAIARAHSGHAEARNRPEGGATVSLTIPIAGPGEARP
jgi:two-component system OmpR family sensor kinase